MTPEMEKNLGDLNALVKRVTVVDWDTTTRIARSGISAGISRSRSNAYRSFTRRSAS